MIKLQGIIISFVTSVTETVVKVVQEYCKPCLLVLIICFESWSLGKVNEKMRF